MSSSLYSNILWSLGLNFYGFIANQVFCTVVMDKSIYRDEIVKGRISKLNTTSYMVRNSILTNIVGNARQWLSNRTWMIIFSFYSFHLQIKKLTIKQRWLTILAFIANIKVILNIDISQIIHHQNLPFKFPIARFFTIAHDCCCEFARGLVGVAVAIILLTIFA